jgi:hypothetical protein
MDQRGRVPRLRSKPSVRMQRQHAPRDDRAAECDVAMAACGKELRLCQGGYDDAAEGVMLQLQRGDLQRLVPVPQPRVSVHAPTAQHSTQACSLASAARAHARLDMRAEGDACGRSALSHPAAVAFHCRHADEERGGAQAVERRRRVTARARGAKTGRRGCSERCAALDDVVAVLTRLHGAEVKAANAVLQRGRKAEFPGAGCYVIRRAGARAMARTPTAAQHLSWPSQTLQRFSPAASSCSS